MRVGTGAPSVFLFFPPQKPPSGGNSVSSITIQDLVLSLAARKDPTRFSPAPAPVGRSIMQREPKRPDKDMERSFRESPGKLFDPVSHPDANGTMRAKSKSK
ncbi:hypothetical protein ZHAS_00004530 [Anopheles sinensis]|uniref:Uncharacterized protein n=1 Tax=Anopheles sinensis TaxID=74873 RepID=A0A084VH61_ANOSI|nr:hypothetical protein ZHAS_00004530 [Anopheles sinensis]